MLDYYRSSEVSDHRRAKMTVEDAAIAIGADLSPLRGETRADCRYWLLHEVLPYGRWICADGREILFSRGYKPLWQRYPGGPATRADPHERVKFVKQIWFYGVPAAPASPWRDKKTIEICLDVLVQFGVELPSRGV